MALDMRRRYGVFINGSRKRVEVPLMDNDRIGVGNNNTMVLTTQDVLDRARALAYQNRSPNA